jgi:hypothetical protein
MSKNGLGKRLGDLMNGDQVAGKARVVSATASTATTATSTRTETGFGRGLTTLVSARRDGNSEEVKAKKRQLLPAWFFFAADLLLLGYVVVISLDAPRPFDLGMVLFCAVSIALGCALALIGLAQTME